MKTYGTLISGLTINGDNYIIALDINEEGKNVVDVTMNYQVIKSFADLSDQQSIDKFHELQKSIYRELKVVTDIKEIQEVRSQQ